MGAISGSRARGLRAHLIVKVPFMPEAAWPGTVQRYGYLPAFVNLTLSVADLPGLMSGVFLPLILKSCATWPLLSLERLAVPRGADRLEA